MAGVGGAQEKGERGGTVHHAQRTSWTSRERGQQQQQRNGNGVYVSGTRQCLARVAR